LSHSIHSWSESPITVSHVDSLNQYASHFRVADLPLLEADTELVADELAVCIRELRRYLSVLVNDVETNWEAVARKQPSVKVRTLGGTVDFT